MNCKRTLPKMLRFVRFGYPRNRIQDSGPVRPAKLRFRESLGKLVIDTRTGHSDEETLDQETLCVIQSTM